MIDDYCEHFALKVDPFLQEIFYPAPSQVETLEALMHQVQFGDSAVVLTGEKGCGKSTLLQELSRRLEQEVYLLVAEDFSSQELLLQTLAEELLLPVEVGMSASALEGLIAGLAAEQDPSVAPAILVDNAEQLPPGALLTLLRLATPVKTRRAMRLVLVCPHGFAEQLPAQMVPVRSMPLDEAVALLNARMQAAGYNGVPIFNEVLVEPWWQAADGNLVLLQRQAVHWLGEQAAAPAPAGASFAARLPASPVPLGHIIGVALLLGALGVVYIYQRDSSDSSATDTDARVVSLPKMSTPARVSAQSSSAPAVISTEPANLVPANEVDESEVDAVSSVEVEAVEPLGNVTEPEEASAEAPAAGEPRPAVAADTESLRPAASELTEDEREVLSWPATAYTLQVLAVTTRQSAEAFRARHSDLPLLILETRRQGKPWYVVVAGRYNTSDLARRALINMPEKVKDAKPWPRRVEELQAEIQ